MEPRCLKSSNNSNFYCIVSAWQIPPEQATCRFGVLFLFASHGRWAFVPDFPARFRLMATLSCCRRDNEHENNNHLQTRTIQFVQHGPGDGCRTGCFAWTPWTFEPGSGAWPPPGVSACDALVSSSPSVLSDPLVL